MHILKIIGLIKLIIGLSVAVSFSQVRTTPLQELQKIGLDMKQFDHVEYSYYSKAIRSYADDTIARNGQMYFESNTNDSAIGFKFYHQSENSTSFYNGDYIVTMLHLDSSVIKKPLCDYQDGHMTLYAYLELSYGAIQNFLTDSLFCLRTDSVIRTDTILNKNKCYSYSFLADNVLVDTHKKIKKGRKKINLIVREKDHIPMQYSQKTKNQYNVASFSNYSFDRKYPEDLFTIENIPSYYKWDKFKAIMKILPTDVKAPDWELPLVNGGTISLSNLRGNFVLLDFWFIGYGSCIQSIPALNALQTKYDNLEVIGVNCFSKNAEMIKKYCDLQGMNYKNVWNGDIICENYNVRAAPIFYLIDKNGLIIYSQIGHDKKKLKDNVERLINYTP